MQGFLLLVLRLNVDELSELILQVRVVLVKRILEVLDHREPAFLIQSYAMLFLHVFDIFELIWHHKGYGLPGRGNTGRSSDAINILFDVRGEVVLEDPIHTFEVEAARCDVSANQ